jgi:ribosome assembly protein YihI (activator of Der GTPase)
MTNADTLEAPAAAPEPATTEKKPAARKAKKNSSKKGVKAPKPKKEAAKRPKAAKKETSGREPREGSKTSIILDLIKRAKGATMAQIMEATGWQTHSVRGFISGTLGKKMGLKVESTKNEKGEHVYKLA